MKLLNKIYTFYLEGFMTMPAWGRKVWVIVLLKLFVMFFVLKLFFFRDTLKNRYNTDEERANHVLEEIIIH